MIVYNTRVPPKGREDAKILIIGESPGEKEEQLLEPFVGPSGDLLTEVLNRNNISRADVRLANLSNYRPQNNYFNILEDTEDGKRKLYESVLELKNYINQWHHNINVIIALGEKPLNYLTGKFGIGKYRGSILQCNLHKDIKVVPTYHPSNVLRNQDNYPIFNVDIKRAYEESLSKEFNYTKREFYIVDSGLELIQWQDKLNKYDILSCDVENVEETNEMLCCGFAPSPNLAITFPWNSETIPVIKQLMENEKIQKVFHFGVHDKEVLYLNGINVVNYYWDTLTGQHILEPQLQKSLAFLTSIHTREPYYKEEGRGEIPDDTKVWGKKSINDKKKLYIYNCKDCAVTAEIQPIQLKELEKDSELLKCFQHEMDMLEIANDISRTGMLIDLDLRNTFDKVLQYKWAKLQYILNAIGGKSINVNSPKDIPWLLYDEFKLPVQRKRKKEKGGSSVTTDEDAIVNLITICTSKLEELSQQKAKDDWSIKLNACKIILQIRGIRKALSSYIRFELSPDNRCRSTYIVSGPETGRWSASCYIDGTGINGQTLPRGYVEAPDNFNWDEPENYQFDVSNIREQLLEPILVNEEE